MITITIAGERAEGKTHIGLVIRWILDHLTNYQVDYTETGDANTFDNQRRIDRTYREMLTPDFKSLEPRRVSIVVINTRHNYNDLQRRAIHDIK